MVEENTVTVVAGFAATIDSSVQAMTAAIRIASACSTMDRRSFKSPPSKQFTIRRSQLTVTEIDENCHKAWFVDQLRCSEASVDKIGDLVFTS